MQSIFDLFCDLVGALHSPSAVLRREALVAIGRIADRECTNVLVDAIRSEPDLYVRANLIRVLGQIGTSNLIPFLLEYLKDQDARVRSNTIEALGAFRSAATDVCGVIRPLMHDPDNRVVGTAIKVLHDLGDPSGLAMLSGLLRGDSNLHRCSAIWAVGEIRYDPELPTLVGYLGSASYPIHAAAFTAVKKFGARALPTVLEALHRAIPVRKAFLVRMLGEIGEPSAIGTACELLADEAEVVRTYAIEALGSLGARGSVDRLLSFLDSPLPAERLEVVKTLRLLEASEAAHPIAQLAGREKDTRVLSACAAALGAIGDPAAVPHLRALLTHTDRRVRANAVEALGQIGDRRIIEELRPFLADPDNRVSSNAAVALFEFGDLKVLEVLKERLRTGDEMQRMSVAYALGQVGLLQVVPSLVSAIADHSARVRSSVLRALVSKGEAAVAPLMAALGEDPKLLEKPGVPALLGQLGVREALDPLLKLAKEPPRGESQAEIRERIKGLFEQLHASIDRDQLHLGRHIRGPTRETIAALRELLVASDASLRCFALFTMGELNVGEAVAPSICLLADPDATVRSYAAEALGKLADPRSRPFLESRVADEDAAVRSRVVRALGAIASPESRPILERIAGQGDEALASEAREALGHIPSPVRAV